MTKLHEIFPTVTAQVLDFLIEEFEKDPNKDFDRYMISRGADVTTRSLVRHLPILKKEGVITLTRKGGQNRKLEFYKLAKTMRTGGLIKFAEVPDDTN